MAVPEDALRVNPLVNYLLERFTELSDTLAKEDPKEELIDPPELRVLRGFLGTSDEEGFTRLYQDVDLANWSDLPTKYIVYVEHLDRSDSRPWGEDVVWMVRGSILHEELPGDAGKIGVPVYRPTKVHRG